MNYKHRYLNQKGKTHTNIKELSPHNKNKHNEIYVRLCGKYCGAEQATGGNIITAHDIACWVPTGTHTHTHTHTHSM